MHLRTIIERVDALLEVLSAAILVVVAQYLCGCGQTLRAHFVLTDDQIRVQIRKGVVIRMSLAKPCIEVHTRGFLIGVNGVNVG